MVADSGGMASTRLDGRLNLLQLGRLCTAFSMSLLMMPAREADEQREIEYFRISAVRFLSILDQARHRGSTWHRPVDRSCSWPSALDGTCEAVLRAISDEQQRMASNECRQFGHVAER